MDDDLLDELSSDLGRAPRPRAPVYRQDRHLATALITTEISYMFANRENPRALRQEHIELLNTLDDEKLTILPSEGYLSWALNHLGDHGRGVDDSELREALSVAFLTYSVSLEDYTGIKKTHSLAPSELTKEVFKAKQALSKAVEKICLVQQRDMQFSVGSIRYKAFGGLHLAYVTPNRVYVITHAHFVAYRDIVNSWFSVLIYSAINKEKYPFIDFYQQTETHLLAGKADLNMYGVDFYAIMKSWPSLMIGVALRDLEQRPDFLNLVLADLGGLVNSFTVKLITCPKASIYSVQLGLELTGLAKCFGHPNIDVDKSVAAWFSKGICLKPDLEIMGNEIACAFRLEFCRQFYKAKRAWPKMQMGVAVPDRIKKNYYNGTWTERPDQLWSHMDFQHAQFEKNLEFDYHVDLADLLSDKAIIPERDQWIHEYDAKAHRTNHGRFPHGPKPTSKSVIIHYLKQESISVKDVIDRISNNDVPESWRVAVAVMKEREFKADKARCFGKMTFEMRLYQTATEKNIADHIFPFIKHQSMTMSEEQLVRTILAMNRPIIHLEGDEHVFIVLDFSSWCTNFRYELVTPLFRELDRLFGILGVYEFTQLFPMISILLFQDRFTPPEQDPATGLPRQGPRCCHGPEAWLEGLRQKGWTLATVLIILLASWELGTSASLLGQGDNQVILLKIPPQHKLEERNMTKDEYISTFLQTLKGYCDRSGIIIKVEESWYSSQLFEYSRKYHIRGCQVSTALKRISRLASEANQTIATLNGDLSGLFSTGAAAAAEDIIPRAAYVTTLVEASLRLWEANPWLKKRDLSHTSCLLMLTRTVGGYPITIYPQFCTRAVQDVLTTNLHLIRTALRDPRTRDGMRWAGSFRISTRRRDPLALIQDPQSLPLDIPRQPENYLRGIIRSGLTDFVVNVNIKALFSLETDDAQASLVTDLLSLQPPNIKLMNKLYSVSNIGLQQKWISRFASSRSIRQTAFGEWAETTAVTDYIKILESVHCRYLERKKPDLALICEVESTACLTVFAQHLRERSWGIPIEGVTMAAQQEQTRIIPWVQLRPEQISSSILVTRDRDGHDLPYAHTRGSKTPYFGSITKMRARKAPLQVIEVGNMVTNIKELLEIRSWVKGNAVLEGFIDKLISEKTPIEIGTLLQYGRSVYSGAITHRLSCPTLGRSGLANTNLNFNSHFTVNSDTATKYARKGKNYTICYQSAFLYGLITLAHYYVYDIPIDRLTAINFCCTECIWEIPPETFTMAHSEYPGVRLPMIVETLSHKTITYMSERITTGDDIFGYSIIMARKFAIWITNREITDQMTTLENRAIDESIVASFVNLSEFSRLSVPTFLRALLLYFHICNPRFSAEPYDQLGKILDVFAKSSYDVLLDSFAKCSLTRYLYALTGVASGAVSEPWKDRMALFHALTNLQNNFWPNMEGLFCLTPEDTLIQTIQLMKVRLYYLKIPDFLHTKMTEDDLSECVERYYPELEPLYPFITRTEEEAVANIRNQDVIAIHDSGDIPLIISAIPTVREDHSKKIAHIWVLITLRPVRLLQFLQRVYDVLSWNLHLQHYSHTYCRWAKSTHHRSKNLDRSTNVFVPQTRIEHISWRYPRYLNVMEPISIPIKMSTLLFRLNDVTRRPERYAHPQLSKTTLYESHTRKTFAQF